MGTSGINKVWAAASIRVTLWTRLLCNNVDNKRPRSSLQLHHNSRTGDHFCSYFASQPNASFWPSRSAFSPLLCFLSAYLLRSCRSQELVNWQRTQIVNIEQHIRAPPYKMSSFITNLFPSSQGNKNDSSSPTRPPPLQTRTSQMESFNNEGPGTPNRTNFITPVSTPQGSPSKKTHPPGAHDLPTTFDNAMKLTQGAFGSPTKSARGTPLSPGKSNALAVDDSYFGNAAGNIDDSIVHKSAMSPGSPLRKQGKENTPPSSRHGQALDSTTSNQAALSRQDIYQHRELQAPTQKKYNTQRGLTPEELEILQKPNVKRLANVTQLCKSQMFFLEFPSNVSQTS